MVNISVVIPSYNKSDYIKTAINSVLSQTVNDFDLIIVDGGSTDNSVEIINSIHDPRIYLIDRGKGVDPSGQINRNIGIREARSDFVAFLDADDWWTPCHLEALLKLRKSFPNAGIYGTIYQKSPKEKGDKKLEYALKKYYSSNFFDMDIFFWEKQGFSIIQTSSLAIDRQKAYNVGIFREDISHAQDRDFFGRIALKYRTAYSLDGISFYRLSSNQVVRSFSKGNFCDEKSGMFLSEKSIKVSNDLKPFMALAKFYFHANSNIFDTVWVWTFQYMRNLILERKEILKAIKLFKRAWRYYEKLPREGFVRQFLIIFAYSIIPRSLIPPLRLLKRYILREI